MTTTPTLPSPSVHYERVGERGVALLTLDRPQTRNALGPAEWHALGRHLAYIAADEAVRVVVLTGAGGAFSSGGDLHTMPARLELPPSERQERLWSDAQVIRALYELNQPVIAAIPGPCFGAGLSLALVCDLRLCAPGARFAASFHRIGLTGDFGLLWLLPRVVGPARAMELLMTAEPIDAARAEAIGLVQRIVPAEQLGAAALALAEQLAAGPPLAQAMTKRGLRRALQSDLAAMLEWESMAQTILGKTEDAREGVAAFLEKRAPKFSGR
jgi:2-(1,2-epoxy-1,2-dihydrophenyl)acetyl-CoA isomerase